MVASHHFEMLANTYNWLLIFTVLQKPDMWEGKEQKVMTMMLTQAGVRVIGL